MSNIPCLQKIFVFLLHFDIDPKTFFCNRTYRLSVDIFALSCTVLHFPTLNERASCCVVVVVVNKNLMVVESTFRIHLGMGVASGVLEGARGG